MIADKLPSVLQHHRGSISMERALKNVLDVLNRLVPPEEDKWYDRLQVAIDDIETMLEKGFE